MIRGSIESFYGVVGDLFHLGPVDGRRIVPGCLDRRFDKRRVDQRVDPAFLAIPLTVRKKFLVVGRTRVKRLQTLQPQES